LFGRIFIRSESVRKAFSHFRRKFFTCYFQIKLETNKFQYYSKEPKESNFPSVGKRFLSFLFNVFHAKKNFILQKFLFVKKTDFDFVRILLLFSAIGLVQEDF